MKKPLLILLAFMILASLAACERSYSKAPVATTAPGSLDDFPTPAGGAALTIIMTQTAMAAAGGVISTPAGVILPTNTQPPAEPTAVPPTPTSLPTMIPVPTATPGLPSTWTLHQGEYPYCIARRFNINPGELLDYNGLGMDARPAEGTVLKIPTGADPWPSGSRSLMVHPDRWTVDPGDTIYGIACAYGDVDPDAIIYANALESPYTLSVGQVLNIP